MPVRPVWALLIGLGMPVAMAAGPQIVLRTVSQDSTPPKFIQADGRVGGLCPDILHAIERADGALRFDGLEQFLPTAQIESALNAGRIDAFCGLIKLPRRAGLYRFIDTPVYFIQHRALVRIDDPVEVRDLADLKQKSQGSYVITANGFSFVDQLRAAGIPVDDSSSDNAVNLKKLLGNRGRFFYLSSQLLAEVVQREHAADKVRVLPVVFNEEPLHLVTALNLDPAVVARIASAMKRLDASGELARLRSRYAPAFEMRQVETKPVSARQGTP